MSEESTNITGIDEDISNLMYFVLNNSFQNTDSECHGCSGKGWIENSKGDLKKCPVCDGNGKLKQKVKPCEKATEYIPWTQIPWYPYPVPCDLYPTYPTITYYNIKTDSCTNCNKQK